VICRVWFALKRFPTTKYVPACATPTETFTRSLSNFPFPLTSRPTSEYGGVNVAAPTQVVKVEKSEIDRFQELVAVTVATSQPVALGGIATFTTNFVRAPDVRFPVSGSASPSVSPSGAVPVAFHKVVAHVDVTATSNVSFTLVPVFWAVRLYQIVSPDAPLVEAEEGERETPMGAERAPRTRSP